MTVLLIVISALGTIPKGLKKGLEDLEIRGQVDIVIKIGQNLEKIPGELRRFAVIQTPVKDHQVKLV